MNLCPGKRGMPTSGMGEVRLGNWLGTTGGVSGADGGAKPVRYEPGSYGRGAERRQGDVS